MRSPLGFFLALLHALRRRWRRAQVARLLSSGLPRAGMLVARGQLPAPPPRPTLRALAQLPDPREDAGGEYLSMPLGAQAIRGPGKPPPRLFRLAALPPRRLPLGALEPRCFRLDQAFAPSADALRIGSAARLAERHRSVVREPRRRRQPSHASPALGQLRLANFGLDEAARPRALTRAPRGPDASLVTLLRPPPPLLLPTLLELATVVPARWGLDEQGLPAAARDQPATAGDRPAPVAKRGALPSRSSRARAPLDRFDPRAFRLDRITLEPANEVLLPPRAAPWSWVHPLLQREVAGEPALERAHKPAGSLPHEWFAWWQDVVRGWEAPGPGEPGEWPVPEGLWWQMQECKEQMLIRRDVAKDENPPLPSEYYQMEYGDAILQKEPIPVTELIEKPTWIDITVQEVGTNLHPMPATRATDDAYFQWRALLRGLSEF